LRPQREIARNNGQTYFVTSNTAERKCFFRSEKWADLFVETLYEYRPERFAIHGFVVMEDHFHLFMTPAQSLERAVQCVKGGFSYRAKKYLGWNGDVWAVGFSDHRIRDEEDYVVHQRYIVKNALECRGIEHAEQHPYCSAGGRFELDAFPQGLKPGVLAELNGATEVAPFQNQRSEGEIR
jgi:putative transposase